MIAEKALLLRPSIQSAMRHGLLDSSLFAAIFDHLSKLRTLCHVSTARHLGFHMLTNSLSEKVPRWYFAAVRMDSNVFSDKHLSSLTLRSAYLQCSQQNTNSCTLFFSAALYFQHLMNSLYENTRGREGDKIPPTPLSPPISTGERLHCLRWDSFLECRWRGWLSLGSSARTAG
jgi:hypothetical protein